MGGVKAFALLVLLVLILVFPVYSQEDADIPPEAGGLVNELSNAVETNGAVATILFGAVVVLAIVVLVMLRVASPLINALVSAQRENAESRRMLVELYERGDRRETAREERINESRQVQAQAIERAAKLMSEMETRPEAQASRKSAVEAINQHITDAVQAQEASTISQVNKHTDEVVQALEQKVVTVASEMETLKTDLKQELKKKLDTEEFLNRLKPIADGIASINHEFQALKDLLTAMPEPQNKDDQG